jgi:hypothetical protein
VIKCGDDKIDTNHIEHFCGDGKEERAEERRGKGGKEKSLVSFCKRLRPISSGLLVTFIVVVH